jgi:hypothetical protein
MATLSDRCQPNGVVTIRLVGPTGWTREVQADSSGLWATQVAPNSIAPGSYYEVVEPLASGGVARYVGTVADGSGIVAPSQLGFAGAAPSGGTTDQALLKNSNGDFDYGWGDIQDDFVKCDGYPGQSTLHAALADIASRLTAGNL